MGPGVVAIAQPGLEGLIEILEGCALESRQKLSLHGLEEAFNFATPLGFVRFGVDQGDTQRGGDLLEVR